MAMHLTGTRTEENLQKAFAGESQAQSKYTFFAAKAKREGFIQIGQIFEETAANEREHAKMWFKILNNGIQSTAINLEDAVNSENYESMNVYPVYARIAREEGFPAIAKLFEEIAKIEKQHENRFLTLLDNVEEGKVFTKDGDAIWQCSNCGYICIGKNAPETCPVCAHSQSWFQLKCDNYK